MLIVANKEDFEAFEDGSALEKFFETLMPICITFSTAPSADGIPRMVKPSDVIHNAELPALDSDSE